jgi:CRISPR system Cascade subunit CasC
VLVAVLRDRGSWSLANAFLKPVRVEAESDLVSSSALRLFDYWSGLTTMYGNGELKGAWACALDRQSLADAAAKAGVEMVASVDEVWTSVASHLE